jgi:hypothetical protein
MSPLVAGETNRLKSGGKAEPTHAAPKTNGPPSFEVGPSETSYFLSILAGLPDQCVSLGRVPPRPDIFSVRSSGSRPTPFTPFTPSFPGKAAGRIPGILV